MAVNYTAEGPIGSVAFFVHPATPQNDITINTNTTVVWGTEIFDIGSNFASNTFTAPVTGKYQISTTLYVNGWDADCSYVQTRFHASNRLHYFHISDGDIFSNDPTYFQWGHSMLIDMDANDTVYVNTYQAGGLANLDINTNSDFQGFLAA